MQIALWNMTSYYMQWLGKWIHFKGCKYKKWIGGHHAEQDRQHGWHCSTYNLYSLVLKYWFFTNYLWFGFYLYTLNYSYLLLVTNMSIYEYSTYILSLHQNVLYVVFMTSSLYKSSGLYNIHYMYSYMSQYLNSLLKC